MPPLDELLELARTTALRAGLRLQELTGEQCSYVHAKDHTKEIKALADTILDELILQSLLPSGLPILSEESGTVGSADSGSLRFIVDPLDGTFNFVKSLGPSCVCIALWEGMRPVFGVIYDLQQRQLAWGGPGLGAFAAGRPISVSNTCQLAHASICTGFPVRFDFDSDDAARRFLRTVRSYAKVRMLGSAAASLLHVARGSADVYLERNIMLWDVAAGIAIVAGAGGQVYYAPGSIATALDVCVSNGNLPAPMELLA
jgi:myo-inositol-1(or 4)-monophosphatase